MRAGERTHVPKDLVRVYPSSLHALSDGPYSELAAFNGCHPVKGTSIRYKLARRSYCTRRDRYSSFPRPAPSTLLASSLTTINCRIFSESRMHIVYIFRSFQNSQMQTCCV